MRANCLTSGWAVGAIFFGEVGPDVERLETGRLSGHGGRSDRSVVALQSADMSVLERLGDACEDRLCF